MAGKKIAYEYGEKEPKNKIRLRRTADGEKGATLFFCLPWQKVRQNGGAASGKLTLAHGALGGILEKKVRQRTATRAISISLIYTCWEKRPPATLLGPSGSRPGGLLVGGRNTA